MNTEQYQISEEELKKYFELSGRALRYFHEGDYESAIRLYEQLVNQMAFLPNILFLSRSYVEMGRISDAISVLEGAIELNPDAEEISEALRSLRERAHEFLIKNAVLKIQEGEGATWCRQFFDINSDLANSTFFEIIRVNTLHYAQINNSRIVSALVLAAMVLSDQLKDPTIMAFAKELEGIEAYVSCDYNRALFLLQKALALFRGIGKRKDIVSCLNHLGMAAAKVGSFSEGIAAYNEAIFYYESVNDKLRATRTIENLADLYLQSTDYGQALKFAKQTEEFYFGIGDEGAALKAMSFRGKCLASMGQLQEALLVLAEAVDKGRSVWSDNPIILGDALLSKSYVLADMNRLKESQEAQREAKKVYNEAGVISPDRTADAILEDKMNEFDEAVTVTRQNIREFEESGMLVEAAREKMNLSYLYSNRIGTITLTGFEPVMGDVRAEIALAMHIQHERPPLLQDKCVFKSCFILSC